MVAKRVVAELGHLAGRLDEEGHWSNILSGGEQQRLAAARALVTHSSLDARAVVEQAMAIAADICIYTNRELTLEEI